MRRYSVEEVAEKTGMAKVWVKRMFGDQKTALPSEIVTFSPPVYDNAKILAHIATRDVRVLWACKIADHCFKISDADISSHSRSAVQAAKQYIVGNLSREELGKANSLALTTLVDSMTTVPCDEKEKLARVAYHVSETALSVTDESSAYSAWCVLTTATTGEAFDKRWINELVKMMEL